MANYGIGIGAFADGFMRGMTIGEKYRNASKEWEAEKVRREALDAANKEREAAIAAETDRLAAAQGIGPQAPAAPTPDVVPQQATAQPVSTPEVTPVPGSSPAPQTRAPATPAAGGLTPSDVPAPVTPTKQAEAPQGVTAERTIETPPPAQAAPSAAPAAVASTLGTSSKPMTKAQAREIAEKSAPSVMEFFQKRGVPKIAETYLAQGDVAKAEAWSKWAEDAQGKRDMKTWAKAWRATQMGDVEGAANHVFELYKSYADGSTPISKEVVKDKDGTVTGFNVKLRDDATGEERSTFVGRDQLLNMGLSALSPPQMFEQVWKQKLAQDKAKADAAAKAGEIKMQTAKDIAVERAKQGGRIELEGVKSQSQSARDAQKHEYDLERDVQKGKIDAQNQSNKVQQELDAKIGVLQKAGYSEEFIKNALPEILGVGTYKKATSPEEAKRLAFSDRAKNDPTFMRKTPDQQRALIEQDMALIYGGLKPGNTPSAGGAASSATPSPAARGLPVLDTKTGKIIYRD